MSFYKIRLLSLVVLFVMIPVTQGYAEDLSKEIAFMKDAKKGSFLKNYEQEVEFKLEGSETKTKYHVFLKLYRILAYTYFGGKFDLSCKVDNITKKVKIKSSIVNENI